MIIEISAAFVAGLGVAVINKYVINNPRVSSRYTRFFKCCKENKPNEPDNRPERTRTIWRHRRLHKECTSSNFQNEDTKQKANARNESLREFSA